MKQICMGISLVLGLASCAMTALPAGRGGLESPRVTESFDRDWLFCKGDPRGASDVKFDDANWRRLNVPHDWSIEGPFDAGNPTGTAGGFLPAGVGWYRKHFQLPASAADQRIFIDFDGVMANSDVWINGTHLGHRPNGYVSFEYELTGAARAPGDNVIAVRCDNSLQPASRWYCGAGIYRHVRLVITNAVHLDHSGTFVTTPSISHQRAVVSVQNNVVNEDDGPRQILVRTILLDPAGHEVASGQTLPMMISSGKLAKFSQSLVVLEPRLWNLDQPNLYQAKVQVVVDDRIVDGISTTFGIREFHFDARTGFWLNGENIKILGCCLHSDGGAFGAAAPLGIWQRRLASLRAIGCNAIRTSHNPPDPALLDLCDRMGFLVMDEMFDVWTVGKTPLESRQTLADYHLYFHDWWRKDVTDTVMRDRNHPCVIIYGGGNEIHDITAHSDLGFRIFRPLRELYHQLDPTRPLTLALLRPNQTDVYENGFADLLDVVGQNYRENELVAAHESHPQWKIIGTENRLEPRAWMYLRDTPAYSGQFIWTGYDYLGESPAWPIVGASSGLFDRTGVARPWAYQAKSWWTKSPMVYIARQVSSSSNLPAWQRSRSVSDWSPADPPGTTEHLEIFTNCPQVELFLNGKSLGMRKLSSDASPLQWTTPFVPGILKAVAHDDAGKVVATYELRTAGAPARLMLVSDRPILSPDWNDLAIVRAAVVDSNGTMIPDATNLIRFTLHGPGVIAAVDSGDNTSHEPFHAASRHAYQGQCIAMIQAIHPGQLHIAASAENLPAAQVNIQVESLPATVW